MKPFLLLLTSFGLGALVSWSTPAAQACPTCTESEIQYREGDLVSVELLDGEGDVEVEELTWPAAVQVFGNGYVTEFEPDMEATPWAEQILQGTW